jgi:uncharacterized peroxidase-related enzyme
MFLSEPPPSVLGQQLHDEDRETQGYVDNLTRLWCWRPELMTEFFALRGTLTGRSDLSSVDLAVLNAATAAACGSAYCALAIGSRLAALTDVETAANVVSGSVAGLDLRSEVLSRWARQVALSPTETTAADVQELRTAGLSDRQIFEATMTIAMRQAFATINDALGAEPDQQLAGSAPAEIRAVVDFGRPPAGVPSS